MSKLNSYHYHTFFAEHIENNIFGKFAFTKNKDSITLHFEKHSTKKLDQVMESIEVYENLIVSDLVLPLMEFEYFVRIGKDEVDIYIDYPCKPELYDEYCKEYYYNESGYNGYGYNRYGYNYRGIHRCGIHHQDIEGSTFEYIPILFQ